MPNARADEARRLDDAALAAAVNEAYRELFNLQFQKGTRQLQDATAVKRARRQIARLRTILRQRQLAAVAGVPLTPLTAAPAPVVSPQKQRALDERREQEEATAAARAEAEAEAEGAAVDAAPSPDAVAADALDRPAAAAEDAPPAAEAAADAADTPDADAPAAEEAD